MAVTDLQQRLALRSFVRLKQTLPGKVASRPCRRHAGKDISQPTKFRCKIQNQALKAQQNENRGRTYIHPDFRTVV
jgi:hypothetical protein